MIAALRNLNRPPAEFDPTSLQPPTLPQRRWPVTALALDVAGRCNIACRYCAEGATQPQRRPAMSTAVLDEALTLLDDTAATPTIRLGSGEPLLARPLLRTLAGRIAARARTGRPVPQVHLTTNGTLADDTTRNFLADSGWQVKVSLDGPEHTHDKWRVTATDKGTWLRAAATAADLAQRIPHHLSATAVLCRGADPQEVFDSIAALGVRRIELVPAVHADQDVLPDAADLLRYRNFVTHWVENFIGGKTGAEPVRLVNMARRVMGYDVKRVVCGAGRNFFGVGAEGALYPCFRFVGLEQYRVGDVHNGPGDTACAEFAAGPGRPYETRRACGKCWAAPLCGGPCFASAELFGPGAGEPFAVQCAYTLADAHAAVELVSRLRELDPERLLRFLPGCPTP